MICLSGKPNGVASVSQVGGDADLQYSKTNVERTNSCTRTHHNQSCFRPSAGIDQRSYQVNAIPGNLLKQNWVARENQVEGGSSASVDAAEAG